MAAAALMLLLVFATANAVAAPIDFLFTGTASGTLGTDTFSDSRFSVRISGDTDDVVNAGADVIWIDYMTGTIEIDGLGTSTFLVPVWVFRNDGSSAGSCVCVGFGNDVDHDLIDVEGEGLGIESWDMTTSFGPIFTATPFFQQFSGVEMDTGVLSFTAMSDVTFSAIVSEEHEALILTLIDEVLELDLTTGIDNGLEAMLDSALNAITDLNENNDVAACNSILAFISVVEAQAGNSIAETDALILIAKALHILESLECP